MRSTGKIALSPLTGKTMPRPSAEQLSFGSPKNPLRGARILFLLDEMAAITAGGTERQILQIIDICNRNGMAPQLCVLRNTRWLTAEIAGCPVKHFNIEKLTCWQGARSLAVLARWIGSQKFDIMQTFFSEGNLVGPVLGRIVGIPIILGTRRNLNHPRKEDPNELMLGVQSFVNILVNQTIVNSQAVLERIVESESISRRRLCVVYNGIDLERMRPAPDLRAASRQALGITDHQILVGNVSGLRKIKGVRMFVDAAAEAYRSDPRLRFLVVGDGELKAELEQSIRSHGLEEIIRLHGPEEDVRPCLAAFDIGVLCSHAEGFSNSLLEYMACGVPVIATDVGGNREALGSAGLLVRPETGEIARAILKMTGSRLRKHFAAAAQLKVKDFDVSIAHDRMTRIYAHYLAVHGGLKKRRIAQFIAHVFGRPLKLEKA